MVQARLFQINKALLGQQSFLPVNFDREYTCLTMTTFHTALIDFRFRQLMSCRNIKKAKGQAADFEMVDVSKIDEFLNEQEQTYVLNGILVESKFETEEEKQKQRQRLIKQYMQKPSLWVPTNMQEFLFCNDFGVLSLNEESVKAYSMDFKNIMSNVYKDMK